MNVELLTAEIDLKMNKDAIVSDNDDVLEEVEDERSPTKLKMFESTAPTVNLLSDTNYKSNQSLQSNRVNDKNLILKTPEEYY